MIMVQTETAHCASCHASVKTSGHNKTKCSCGTLLVWRKCHNKQCDREFWLSIAPKFQKTLDVSATCSKCHHKNDYLTDRGWVALAVLVIIVVFAVGAFIPGHHHGTDYAGMSTASDTCHGAIKNGLTAPATAKFHDSNVTGNDASGYTVTGTVDSENGFGALLTEGFSCTVTVTNGTYDAHGSVFPSNG